MKGITTMINTLKFANSLETYTSYTAEEIIGFTKRASNQYEYDSIIDSLYFKDKHDRRDRKNRAEYSIQTADGLRCIRRKKESSLEYETDVRKVQFSNKEN